jgi:hypothetical protein
MQLESSLFGILVIQIKPQLEKVLNLSADALTKEIKLTQELMELFIKYQIPSDLLSYDEQRGNEDGFEAVTTSSVRLNSVKENVKAMNDMIKASKDEELAERVQEAKYARPAIDFEFSRCEDSVDRCMRPEVKELCKAEEVQKKSVNGSLAKGMSKMSRNSFSSEGSSSASVVMKSSTPVKDSSRLSSAASRTVAKEFAPAPKAVIAATNSTSQTPKTDTKIFEKISEDQPAASGPQVDITQIPVLLDRRYEELDVDAALKPTIINPGASWTKRSQKALLSEPTESILGTSELERERSAAFDLLDALSKSGALTIDCAELHVVIAATHCFDQSVMDTLVQGNVNPIERVERSALIMASTLHHAEPEDLLEASQVARVKELNPQLF